MIRRWVLAGCPATTTASTRIHWRSTFRPARPGTGWIYRAYLTRFITRCVRGLAARAPTTQDHFSD